MNDHQGRLEWSPATIRGADHETAAAAIAECGPLIVLVHGADDGYGWWWTIRKGNREIGAGSDAATMDEAKENAEAQALALIRRSKQ